MPVIKFIRHCGVYMPGDVTGVSDADFGRLTAAGSAVAYGSQPAAATTDFDPRTADIDALKAYLTERGVSFHHKAGEAKLRELAVDAATKD